MSSQPIDSGAEAAEHRGQRRERRGDDRHDEEQRLPGGQQDAVARPALAAEEVDQRVQVPPDPARLRGDERLVQGERGEEQLGARGGELRVGPRGSQFPAGVRVRVRSGRRAEELRSRQGSARPTAGVPARSPPARRRTRRSGGAAWPPPRPVRAPPRRTGPGLPRSPAAPRSTGARAVAQGVIERGLPGAPLPPGAEPGRQRRAQARLRPRVRVEGLHRRPVLVPGGAQRPFGGHPLARQRAQRVLRRRDRGIRGRGVLPQAWKTRTAPGPPPSVRRRGA